MDYSHEIFSVFIHMNNMYQNYNAIRVFKKNNRKYVVITQTDTILSIPFTNYIHASTVQDEL